MSGNKASQRDATRNPVLSVIIPAYNEAATLPDVVRRLEELGDGVEIVIVDDGSVDGTTEIVRRLAKPPRVRTLFHKQNIGKGASIRTGFACARGDVIVIQDADLEYDPADIERLVAPIFAGEADVVFGNRFTPRAGAAWPVRRRAANRFLSWLSNRFTGLSINDMETCYKAMRREVAASLSIRENRFGVEPEITAKIARCGWRICEVPISYRPRDYSDGKKIGVLDGLRAIWCIVRYSVRD